MESKCSLCSRRGTSPHEDPQPASKAESVGCVPASVEHASSLAPNVYRKCLGCQSLAPGGHEGVALGLEWVWGAESPL